MKKLKIMLFACIFTGIITTCILMALVFMQVGRGRPDDGNAYLPDVRVSPTGVHDGNED